MDFAKLSGMRQAMPEPPPLQGQTDVTIRPPAGANYGNGGSGGGGGTAEEPPTREDAKQSVTHHLSSITYNAKHAAAHQAETAKHSQLLLNLLKKSPEFARHAKKV